MTEVLCPTQGRVKLADGQVAGATLPLRRWPTALRLSSKTHSRPRQRKADGEIKSVTDFRMMMQ